jgi:transcription initiation factor TFIIH subunit 4
MSFGVPSETPDKHKVDVNFLDNFARTQWEGILHYVVGRAGVGDQTGVKEPSAAVKELLASGGLIERSARNVDITQAGFSFLLQEINAQVWTILINYLDTAVSRVKIGQKSILTYPQREPERVDILSFLFTLGSLELGQDYSTNLTATQLQMLDDLSDFGIIYRRKPTSHRYYPTRLATTMTSDAGALRSVSAGFDSALRSSDGRGGFIIIETNYRLYAYTSSPLQIAVLQLFTKLSTCYPNMVSGRVTRDSIRRAIQTGITSEQIVSYLTTHAHPQMRKRAQILPPTVVDQIRLWQIENERMTATTGYLFKDFTSFEEYEVPCNYAEEIGVRVWKNDAKRMFFVTKVEMVAELLKKKAAARRAAAV